MKPQQILGLIVVVILMGCKPPSDPVTPPGTSEKNAPALTNAALDAAPTPRP